MLTLCPQPEDVLAQEVKDGVKIPEAAAGSQVGSSPDSHVNTPSMNTTRNGEEVGIDCREARIGGVVFATCCHHVCAWRDYVGQEFLLGLVSVAYPDRARVDLAVATAVERDCRLSFVSAASDLSIIGAVLCINGRVE